MMRELSMYRQPRPLVPIKPVPHKRMDEIVLKNVPQKIAAPDPKPVQKEVEPSLLEEIPISFPMPIPVPIPVPAEPEMSVRDKYYAINNRHAVQSKTARNRILKVIFIILASLVLLMAAAGAAVYFLLLNDKGDAKPSVLGTSVQAKSSVAYDEPNEKPVSANAINSYVTDPSLPKLLTIEKLGVKARIFQQGTQGENNELRAPTSIYDVGWFNKSAKPGETGALVLVGHRKGATKQGVFSEIKNLVAGDKITVERGDGKAFTYNVVKSETFSAENLESAAAMDSAVAGKPGLNLLTFAGSNNSGGDRLVVYTVLAN